MARQIARGEITMFRARLSLGIFGRSISLPFGPSPRLQEAPRAFSFSPVVRVKEIHARRSLRIVRRSIDRSITRTSKCEVLQTGRVPVRPNRLINDSKRHITSPFVSMISCLSRIDIRVKYLPCLAIVMLARLRSYR